MPKNTVEPAEETEGGARGRCGLVERTPRGWRVRGENGEEFSDLFSAMMLADLLAAENGLRESAQRRPPRGNGADTEVERLRVTVAQLEHALHNRVVIEQAIGVLAERHRLPPRAAFERLRCAARSRGRAVAEVAGTVVASSADRAAALPAELDRDQG